MNPILKFFLIILLPLLFISCGNRETKILLFAQVDDTNQAFVEKAKAEFENLKKEQGFTLKFAEETGHFTEDSLSQYVAVIFLHTSGEVLNDVQRADVERFVQAGGKIMGVDAFPEVKN